MRKWIAVIASAGMLVSSAAFADSIEDRQQAMKSNGKAMGVMVKTLKGEMEFDQAAIMEALNTQLTVTEGFADLFPEDSMTGGDTKAAPAIWEDMDGFKAELAALREDVEAAIAAEPASVEELGPLVQEIGSNCQSCHEDYRINDN